MASHVHRQEHEEASGRHRFSRPVRRYSRAVGRRGGRLGERRRAAGRGIVLRGRSDPGRGRCARAGRSRSSHETSPGGRCAGRIPGKRLGPYQTAGKDRRLRGGTHKFLDVFHGLRQAGAQAIGLRACTSPAPATTCTILTYRNGARRRCNLLRRCKAARQPTTRRCGITG